MQDAAGKGRRAPCKGIFLPHGQMDADTVRCVREAGFEVAVTTEERALTSDVDPLLVPRFEIRRSSAFASVLERLT